MKKIRNTFQKGQNEDGVGLIDLIISMAVMAVMTASLLSTMMTSIRTTEMLKGQTDAIVQTQRASFSLQTLLKASEIGTKQLDNGTEIIQTATKSGEDDWTCEGWVFTPEGELYKRSSRMPVDNVSDLQNWTKITSGLQKADGNPSFLSRSSHSLILNSKLTSGKASLKLDGEYASTGQGDAPVRCINITEALL